LPSRPTGASAITDNSGVDDATGETLLLEIDTTDPLL